MCLAGAAGGSFWLAVFMQVQDVEDTPPCRAFFFFEGLLRAADPAVLKGAAYVAFSGTALKRHFLRLLEIQL